MMMVVVVVVMVVMMLVGARMGRGGERSHGHGETQSQRGDQLLRHNRSPL
jgi:flagellar basal body-associated protein FliL